MVKTQEFYFSSSARPQQCFAKEWLPEGQIRGVVQIVHGVAEYVERYDHLARFLTAHGFLVTGEDHLGHGKTVTDGKYGYFAPTDGWWKVASDVHRLQTIQQKKYQGLPYFLFGHSMGSFLTRTLLARWPGEVDGAVLSGTGQEPPYNVSLGKLIAKANCLLRSPDSSSKLIESLAFGAYNRNFKPNRTTADWITRDTEVVDAYVKDPLCSFLPTAGMFRDMMEGLQYIGNPANLKAMDPNVPIYFYSGDKDPVGGNGKGVRKVYQLFLDAGCTDVTLKLYPGGRHEMHNELNREEVFADLLAWLEAHLPHS